MVKNCDFVEQETHESDGVRIRPDMVVRLPGDRSLVVDAKVPLTAYLDAVGAVDDASRRAALQRHGQQEGWHVRQFGSKQHWRQYQPAAVLGGVVWPGGQL